MASVYAAGKGTSSDAIASAAKAAAIGAAYKTVPVREAAAALLEAMVNSVGLADVQRAVQGVSDKALSKAASDALAKVTAANGGAGGMLSAGPSQASGVGAARPPAARSGSSRPGTAGSSKGVSRPGSVGGVTRPGTASSGAGRGLTTSSSALSRPGTAAAAAAAACAGPDGPLLALDKGKEERAKKVGRRPLAAQHSSCRRVLPCGCLHVHGDMLPLCLLPPLRTITACACHCADPLQEQQV